MPDNACPHCTELADATRQANERATEQEQRADAYLRKLEAMEREREICLSAYNELVAHHGKQTHAHLALRERHRVVLRAGGIMWRALKQAWQADEEQRVADAMRLVRALRDRDIERELGHEPA